MTLEGITGEWLYTALGRKVFPVWIVVGRLLRGAISHLTTAEVACILCRPSTQSLTLYLEKKKKIEVEIHGPRDMHRVSQRAARGALGGGLRTSSNNPIQT